MLTALRPNFPGERGSSRLWRGTLSSLIPRRRGRPGPPRADTGSGGPGP